MSKALSGGVLILLVITLMNLLPSVHADVPPPIYSAWANSGGPFTLASNVSLPEARVNATIELNDTWTYDIRVSCSFTIASLSSQNLTTAFVYPELWATADPSQTVTMHEFNILVNDTPVEFNILTFDEFKSIYDLNQTDWSYVTYCYFALFNFSINSVEPAVVEVLAHFSSHSSGHNFYFDYIVDTARRWEGNTHEIVQVEFHRADVTDIIECRYYPTNNSEFTGDDYSSVTIWDFTIQEFPFDKVQFIVQQQEYPVYHRPFPNPDLYLISIATITVLLLVVSAIIYRSKRFN